ncbi:MAG: DNA-3-methyladenine glycosylase family protein [Beduini sp.]|uniref:DNA-3-methyladenine glycosylase family protein n=1 Tax=Beduini sp. TaxID=1922300 RepID=UPI0039A348B8
MNTVNPSYFPYTLQQVEQLKSNAPQLGKYIDQIGPLSRIVFPDPYTAMIHTIAAQLISTAATKKIWQKMQDNLGDITPANLANKTVEEIKSCGLTYKKAETIHLLSHKIITHHFCLDTLYTMNDQEAIDYLCQEKGIGPWSAKMILLHGLLRMDIISYEDIAIRKGMCRVYQTERLTKKEFDKIIQYYHPYASIASIYLWRIGTQ